MDLKVIVSNKTNPYLNIAVENWLVAQPDNGSVVMYLWKNRRTVVVGQNQNPFAECNIEQLSADGGYLVRRTTGGGAVYHDDGNINFSFVAPATLYDQSRQFEVIRQALLGYGIESETSGRNDMQTGGRKFSGNAFSRGRSQYLHHGTLLIRSNIDDLTRYLKVSPSKLHKHGVASVQSRVVNLSEIVPDISSENIVPHLVDAFETVYGAKADVLDFDMISRNPEVVGLVEKYSSEEWLYGRWRTFESTRQGRFEWGEVAVGLSIDESKGTITDVTLATDALDVNLAERVAGVLKGASITKRPSTPELADDKPLNDILSLVY